MANIGLTAIKQSEGWVSLETKLDTTFTDGTTYVMQNQGDEAMVCVKTSAPATNEGFLIERRDGKFTYTHATGNHVYVKSSGLSPFNVAE